MKEKNLKKFSRTLRLLNILDAGGVNVVREARELGVTVRTIQRDLLNIEEAQFPIYKAAPGQYKFIEGFSLKKSKLSEREASLLVLMSDMLRPLGGYFQDSLAALTSRLLNTPEASPFFIKLPQGVPYEKTSVTRALEQGIQSQTAVRLTFSAMPEKRFNYFLKPLKIVNYDGFWYAMGLNAREEIKTLRLDKILEIKNTDEFFSPSPKALKALKESTSIYFSERKKTKVVLKVDAEAADYFRRRQYFPLQKIIKTHKDGSLLLETRVSNFQEIQYIIMSWIPHVRIQSPISYIEKFTHTLSSYMQDN